MLRPVIITIIRGIRLEFFDFFSLLEVSVNVESISTIEIPAPTAASVNATSTASRVMSKSADNKLKTPDNITTPNNP